MSKNVICKMWVRNPDNGHMAELRRLRDATDRTGSSADPARPCIRELERLNLVVEESDGWAITVQGRDWLSAMEAISG